MSLNKNYYCLFFTLVLTGFLFSQTTATDTTHIETLNEVVITGQYNPTTINKAINNVIVITKTQIENQAANTLADVLNFNLNLTILPSSQTGKSTISFFGLDGQYFNILIDNIPLVSDSGMGNNIDLTQINLDDIERIEIVEGAMGVEYGANAVSGVINIITKKSSEEPWKIQFLTQEETVSNEYAWFDKGRHIQGLNISHNLSDQLYARIGFNRNDFAGFFDNKQGQSYYQNDGLRGYEWLPKTQYNTNAFLNYKGDKFTLLYKFEYFNEILNYYDETVRSNINVENQTSNPSSTDKIFKTNRLVNNLSINGTFNSGARYDASLSYQEQKRDLNQFNYYIVTQQKSDVTNETYQSSKVLFSKGTINNLLQNDLYNFQLGYEARYNKGFDTQASGDVTQEDKEYTQSNFALFTSSEWKITDALSARPGFRYEYNSKFNTKLLASLSLRQQLKNGVELRGNIGTSYRTPNFQELYYYFVDSNHDVQGNENLNPEKGYTAFINLKKTATIPNGIVTSTLKASYIDINDKIDLAIINSTPLQYEYININAYKLWGLTTDNSLKKEQWNFNFGATIQGISRIAANEANASNDFLYSFQINTSSTYISKKWDTAFSLLFKYNGAQYDYTASDADEEGNSIFSKSKTNAYSWMDASIKKSFLEKKIQATIGARNLLDVTSVAISSTTSGGTHSTNNNGLLLGYGRSFYLKLLYNLNF
ncbi:TonB-dependent receptor plug [Cellulophaga algicola DSM 14237]|uniref:TonB-dependent receptor plug n=1 Tax=Cellulophaga algicola (strain DSM 14237 / IC166 / ACAM 630) TaxID=688270 RepID=E6XEZ2_CELAD|nr:TonB-dependent receptor [Cellulophaga algicola]ADV49214.1 TonB-dependent receptor plug [Cellulophaga algicola DSM 14237]